ncbi:MAG: hypothetical protein Q4D81_07565 [Eubacteriales bacterium]|nr:hypothetical protein [Eubacteriales bacterium]
MKKTEKFNDIVNYSDRAFDYGFRADHVPETPVYAAREGEEVFITALPYNGTPIEEIEDLFDAVDFAMVEELGRSRYLSSLQIYQYVRLRGLTVQRQGIRNRLNKMKKLRLIREYDLKVPEAESGLKAYDLDYKGFQIALHRGVLFHKGNRYLSNKKKQELDKFDTSEDIKRILVGNMIVLASLMNNVSCKRFGIMETMRPTQEFPITDGCIIRTAANIQLDEESILLYEVVRSGPHAMRKLADKVSRYYTLINDTRYLENNYYGYKAVPQLIICGECYDHCVKIDQYLRSRNLINNTDSLLYTEDLFYVRRTLQTLYELDETGKRTWYSLPERKVFTDMEKIA